MYFGIVGSFLNNVYKGNEKKYTSGTQAKMIVLLSYCLNGVVVSLLGILGVIWDGLLKKKNLNFIN